MMSIVAEIERLASAKVALKNAINAKGGALTTEKIDDYAAALTAIPEVIRISGGRAALTSVDGNFRITVGDGIAISSVTLDSPGGRIYATEGATVVDTTIATGQTAADDAELANISLIGSGASGSNISLGLGGAFNLFSGGVVSGVSITSVGVFTIRVGCVASGVNLSGGYFHVSGGVTHDTRMTSGTIALEGGTLSGVTLSGGSLIVSAGAALSGGCVCDGGVITVATGGTIAGNLIAYDGGTIFSGGVDITDQYRQEE